MSIVKLILYVQIDTYYYHQIQLDGVNISFDGMNFQHV